MCTESVLPQPEPLHLEHCYIALLFTESFNLLFIITPKLEVENLCAGIYSALQALLYQRVKGKYEQRSNITTLKQKPKGSLVLPKKGLFILVPDVFAMKLLYSSFLEDLKTRIMSVD